MNLLTTSMDSLKQKFEEVSAENETLTLRLQIAEEKLAENEHVCEDVCDDITEANEFAEDAIAEANERTAEASMRAGDAEAVTPAPTSTPVLSPTATASVIRGTVRFD